MTIGKKIEQAISVPAVDSTKEKKWKMISLKIRMDFLKDVDQAVRDREGMNRNSWILEALQEKLKRLKNDPN